MKLIAKNLDDKGEIKKEWIFKNINKEKEIISDFNIGKALNKLVEDKYLKPSDIKEYYSTTWESLVFIENGGYAKQMEIQNTKLLTQKIINFSLIFGGLMTGAYYMAKACLWIFYHI